MGKWLCAKCVVLVYCSLLCCCCLCFHNLNENKIVLDILLHGINEIMFINYNQNVCGERI